MIYKSEMKPQGVWKTAIAVVALEDDMMDNLTDEEDGKLTSLRRNKAIIGGTRGSQEDLQIASDVCVFLFIIELFNHLFK
jgi:hypothetical protein